MNKQGTKTKPIWVRVPVPLLQKVKELQIASRSKIIQLALEKFLQELEKNHVFNDIQKVLNQKSYK